MRFYARVDKTAKYAGDFYPTPAWATRAMLEQCRWLLRDTGSIWEPACGDGAMSKVVMQFADEDTEIVSSDLWDRGYGLCGVNFLDHDRAEQFDLVITNPPFSIAEEFLKKALICTSTKSGKVALLLPAQFLEGSARYATVFHGGFCPLRKVLIFSDRVKFTKNGINVPGSPAKMFAWFIWDWNHTGPTELDWIKPRPKSERTHE